MVAYRAQPDEEGLDTHLLPVEGGAMLLELLTDIGSLFHGTMSRMRDKTFRLMTGA